MCRYFTTSGRVGRLRHLLVGFAAQALVMTPVISFVLLSSGCERSWLRQALPRLGPPVLILLACFAVVTAWIHVCNDCRRLHDLDRSGWFLLLAPLPLLNWYLSYLLFFARGSSGENGYGLPEGHDAAAVGKGLGEEAGWCPDLRGVTVTPSRPTGW